jgi:hypothetical protein
MLLFALALVVASPLLVLLLTNPKAFLCLVVTPLYLYMCHKIMSKLISDIKAAYKQLAEFKRANA